MKDTMCVCGGGGRGLTVDVGEAGLGLVGGLLRRLGPHEDVGRREHRHNRQHLRREAKTFLGLFCKGGRDYFEFLFFKK